MSNPNRAYIITGREPRGQNMLVHFRKNGRAGFAVFDRAPRGWEVRGCGNDLFFGIANIADDELVVRALRYVGAE